MQHQYVSMQSFSVDGRRVGHKENDENDFIRSGREIWVTARTEASEKED